MSAALMKIDLLDSQIKEGYEYVEPFWGLVHKYYAMRALELEYAYSRLVLEKNEFHRRVKDNDKPGKRHMLPFVQRRTTGYGGASSAHQIPIRFESALYLDKMADYAKRISSAKAAWQRAKAIAG